MRLIRSHKRSVISEIIVQDFNDYEKTITTTKKEETKTSTVSAGKKSAKNSLPSDEYKDEIQPATIPIDDTADIVVSVKRGGEYGLPRVDIRLFSKTDVYTGFTNKGITLDLDKLPQLKAVLCDVIDECEDKRLFEEFSD